MSWMDSTQLLYAYLFIVGPIVLCIALWSYVNSR